MNSLTFAEIVPREVSASSAEMKRSTRTQFQLLSVERTRPSIAGIVRPPGKESGTTRSLEKKQEKIRCRTEREIECEGHFYLEMSRTFIDWNAFANNDERSIVVSESTLSPCLTISSLLSCH